MRIRLTRTLVYEGDEEWVRASLDPSFAKVAPYRPFYAGDGTITDLERKEERIELKKESSNEKW